jgi:hypothetical protein
MIVPKKPLLYKAVPELDTPRYLPADVAAAAGVSPGTLKAWLSRDPRVIRLGPYDQAGRGTGTPRLLTLRRVFAIAMTAELVSLGFIASRAGALAFFFTDVEYLVEAQGDLILAVKRSRDPGIPSFSVLHSEKPLPPASERGRYIADETSLFGPPDDRSVSCTLIDCTALMQRVQARLKERGAT